jgi:hypothetical protein
VKFDGGNSAMKQSQSETPLYRNFTIEVKVSPETNDREVRFIGDGEDLIARFWDEMIGLDPEQILVEPCSLRSVSEPHNVVIARCSCGDIGCGNVEVQVRRIQGCVEWTEIDKTQSKSRRMFISGAGGQSAIVQIEAHTSARVLRFDAASYDREVERALRDTAWKALTG